MYPILFDCDPGHDDIIALMTMLAHPETFHILGITTVAGNNTLELVTDNLLRVLDHLGFSHIPVSAGAARPLCREPQPQKAHGKTGMDGPVLPAPASRVTGLAAADFMRRALEAASEPVTLVATAPLTNVALLLRAWPEARAHICQICLMGGSLSGGNVMPRAEFNIYHDPEAARAVFRSGIPIVMSGLEVCVAAGVPLTAYPALSGSGRAGRLTVDLLDFYAGYSRERGLRDTAIYDLTTVMQLLRPALFTGTRRAVDVATEDGPALGRTFALPSGAPENTLVLEGVDRDAYVALFLESIRALDRLIDERDRRKKAPAREVSL